MKSNKKKKSKPKEVKPEKHAGGRPTEYKPEFHNKDFIRLSKKGKSISQIALEWDVSRDTIYQWRDSHPEFSDTVKKGREFSEAWYSNLGQAAMMGHAQTVDGQKINLNVSLFVWMTKNMFKWSDNNETKQSVNVNLKSDTINVDKKLAKKIDKALEEEF